MFLDFTWLTMPMAMLMPICRRFLDEYFSQRAVFPPSPTLGHFKGW
jgi:hypothetical protein